MSETKHMKLGDIAEFQEGYVNPPQSNSEYFDGPVKWLRAVDMTFNQSCYALKATEKVGDCFVYLAAQHMVAQLQAMAHGSVFSTVTRKTFEAISLAMPPAKLLAAFEKWVVPTFLRIRVNVLEVRTLAQTRDLLLPKLMSGEIRLRDVEKAVEAVE